MLEQMGIARFALWLVLGPDAIPDGHGNNGCLAVFMDQNGQTIVECEFFMRNIDRIHQFRNRRCRLRESGRVRHKHRTRHHQGKR